MKTGTFKCCGRCEKRAQGYNRPDVEDENCDCSCHTSSRCRHGVHGTDCVFCFPSETVEPTEGWEEEFQRLCRKHDECRFKDNRGCYEDFIDFIHTLLAEQKARIVEVALELSNNPPNSHMVPLHQESYERGYRKSCSDIIKALSK